MGPNSIELNHLLSLTKGGLTCRYMDSINKLFIAFYFNFFVNIEYLHGYKPKGVYCKFKIIFVHTILVVMEFEPYTCIYRFYDLNVLKKDLSITSSLCI